MRLLSLVVPCAILAACSEAALSTDPASVAADAGLDAARDTSSPAPVPIPIDDALLRARPYSVVVPPGYEPSTPAPLLIALHGYGEGDDGAALDRYFKLGKVAADVGALYTYPDGVKDKAGNRAWNGTNVCCDFDKAGTNDVGYLVSVIGDIARTHAVDRKRVFVVGLSGGGVMAHRLACDASDFVAGIVSVSGTTWLDPEKCKPTGHVSVVEVHGDKDSTVKYGGGTLQGERYPGAEATFAQWAAANGCSGAREDGPRVDLEASIAGDETRIERAKGCARGAVELWTVEGGPHAPSLSPGFGRALWDVLASHPKP